MNASMVKQIWVFIQIGICLPLLAGEPGAVLTLDGAIEIALDQHPELREIHARIEATEARAIQAGAIPDPEAIARIESAPIRSKSFGRAEYLAGVSQSVPLGGRLKAGREAELTEKERQIHQLEIRRNEIRRSVHGAFAAALFSESASDALRTTVESDKRLVEMARVQLEAGEALPEEVSRLELQLMKSERALALAELLNSKALVALAAAIGKPDQEVNRISGNLEEVMAVSEIEQALEQLELELESGDLEVAVQRAGLKKARRELIPDVQIELLYRRIEDSREDAFDLGFRIPLPLSGRRRGAIREASAEIAAAEARRDQARNRIQAKTRSIRLELVQASSMLKVAKKALSKSETIRKTAEARHNEGDISLGELLLIRRELQEVQEDYLQAVRSMVEIWNSI